MLPEVKPTSARSATSVGEDALHGEPCTREQFRVVICEDNVVTRVGMCALLESEPDFHVVGGTCDLGAMLERVREHQPHVVVLDFHVVEDELEHAVARLRELVPTTKLIALCNDASSNVIHRASSVDVSGIITKHEELARLPDAVRTIMQGGKYLSPRISESLVREYAGTRTAAYPSKSLLTPRQIEILKLIAVGETTRSISHALGITPRTVHTHRSRIMGKLNVHTEGALVYAAFKLGLVTTA